MKKPMTLGQLERQGRRLRVRFAVLKFLNRVTRFSLRYWVEMRMMKYQEDAATYNRRYDHWRKELRRVTRVGHSYR